MKILHVSLGLPPFRTGGLNRYCLDLMREQKVQGENVALLYPGEFALGGNTKIKQTANIEFQVFRIVNPLPLALTSGISDPIRYMKPCKNPEVYKRFLLENRPDIIHVHSFQGIHKEFFEIAQKLKIKMVFTTHDYYPFCPCCVLLQRNGTVCSGPKDDKCALCNQGRGFSEAKEYIMQSRLYEKLKYNCIVQKIRSWQVKQMEQERFETDMIDESLSESKKQQYSRLRQYYLDILRCMNKIHANSITAQNIYQKFSPNSNYCQLGITHAGIEQKEHILDKNMLRFGYVGGPKRYKGLEVLLKAISIIEDKNITNYELWLYGADYHEYESKNPHIHNGGTYTQEIEDIVWSSFDILIVPSQCYETFGFVVTEAIAHGVSVICSDLVGAKQFLSEKDIFKHDSAEDLANCMLKSHAVPQVSQDMISMERHTLQIKKVLYSVC